jgi:hypothetical protein
VRTERPRRAGGLLAGAAAAAVLAGCGSASPTSTMGPQTITGKATHGIIVLGDATLQQAMTSGITGYTRTGRERITSALGTPDAVATAVKDGRIVDVVVLPSGPALDRVRNELVTAPEPIGQVAGTQYWAAAVTGRGLGFFRYLHSRPGAALLARAGLVA